MIAYLEGRVAEKGLNTLVVDVNGVGYLLTCSQNTIMKAPETGAAMRVYTYMAVREDAVELYGFQSREEKSMFLSLTGVTGIGPKSAVQILGSMPLRDLTRAVMEGDVTALSRAQGVGKKTAQRIALELKGKVSDYELKAILGDEAASISAAAAPASDEAADAMLALQQLGYSSQEALRAIAKVRSQATDASELLRLALRNME
ncbi:MAG: Holliday junction branch migration protein RuvA [Clostridia bacterium]|nr:Holliday junction branch migration protein RuvA [Clostridia bacterium]